MMFLFIDNHVIKGLVIKKTLLGQFETNFFQKTYQSELINQDALSVDILASAIKEIASHSQLKGHQEKEVYLILPHREMVFFRTTVATDLTPSTVVPFLKDKALTRLNIDLNQYDFNYSIKENGQNKELFFYGMAKTTLLNYINALSLVGLKFAGLIPEAFADFYLFEKTLRKDKQENILFLSFSESGLNGYLYDSLGLVDNKRIELKVDETENTSETVLKKLSDDFIKENRKINRLILSGVNSEKIRQDTFTKAVGMWTNPLKKIIENFYQDYLKMLVGQDNQPLPLLAYDACFGGFIFYRDNRNWISHQSKPVGKKNSHYDFGLGSPKKLPVKEAFIFIVSFAVSFVLFVLLTKPKNQSSQLAFAFPRLNLFHRQATPTPTPSPITPSPSPTPVINRESLKIKILNGSGTKGKAGELKEILKDKGYSEVVTDNADNFDYQNSEIHYKKDEKNAALLMKNDLKDVINITKLVQASDSQETADISIVIGADFK
ncbi:LytR C-terminal domain-containing protein [Patescibacteria group bacterium]|nr:LytR C-terminal domain-containing protein [Patescibacteria group bacterium]MCL5091431.1 LytR C-terminal domain-containing protein [Patescibacteria group bacterium]